MRAERVLVMLATVIACQPPRARSPVQSPPPVPAKARSALGWRCPPGAAACIDRADLAMVFACTNHRCTQDHPVMPDDGDWTCGETAGVTLCTTGETAAGVAPTGIAPGWRCGDRQGKPGERICRDVSPDFPDGKPSGWRCFYDGPALPRRICVRDPQQHAVGDACDAARPCVDGATCRAGGCVLPHRPPNCWLDSDCPNHSCLLGNCREDGAAAEPPAPAPPAARAWPIPGEDAGHSAPRTRLDFGPPLPQVGFDADFTITVKHVSGPRPPRIRWRQIGGAALPELQVAEDGFHLRGRTTTWRTALGTSQAGWGVVPFSPRNRGAAELEASWDEPGGRHERKTLVVAAAALARGLTTVPVGARVYLGGEKWRIVRAPEDSRARIEDRDELSALLPDVPGVWHLRDGDGRALDLIAGRYEDVPLDCSRAKCHAEMLAGSLASPMTTVMARLLDKFPPTGPNADRAADYPGCALSCHAIGEPGVADGGYLDVARAMARSGDEHAGWAEMPRMLRRLAGAGCISCHGPGAVPDPRASWTTLRSDVCAVCHDSPPLYAHTLAWHASANSRSDRDPDAARKPECVRCHTTWGFLLAEKPDPNATAVTKDHLTFLASLRPPEQAGPIGIACAACHDSHPTVDATGKPPHALLRKVGHPALLPALPGASARRSEICLPCHTPDPSRSTAPFASAAAIWLGRGGLDVVTGAAMEGPAPLAALDGGCLHCHTGDAGGASGGNHSFIAKRERCPDCPPIDLVRPDGIQRRARQLYLDAGLYRVLGDVRPLHASRAVIRRDSAAGRALWNLLLLLEDKAAEIHNPPYAKALLESAEPVLRSRTALREIAGGRR